MICQVKEAVCRTITANCAEKYCCPYLEFSAAADPPPCGRSCAEVLAENQRLKTENANLRGIFDVATKAFKEKEAEIQKLSQQIEVLQRKLRDLLQRPFARNIETGQYDESQDQSAARQEDEHPRKKRGAPEGHRGATRKKPDRKPNRTVFIRPEQCPGCSSHNISPCQDFREHIQGDIIILQPILTRFIKQRGYCRDCGALFFPTGKGERPKGYIGPVAVAVAGCLRYTVKMPFEAVRKILGGLWGLDLTPGALAGFDKKLAQTGRPLYEQLADMVQYSAGINADETSWPVGAINEWLWIFTNQNFAFFKIDPSRARAVAESVLGESYRGVLGSDCFAAYNGIKALAKQKCLTHYERAAKDLEKFYSEDQQALLFAYCLKDIFKRARQEKRDWLEGKMSSAQARQKALAFEEELDQLVEPTVQNEDAEKLRKRLIAHRDENFTFLRYKDVDPDNNRAERALRPSVVMRKITYGNNSETGARNHETLMSLVETAKIHGANPLDLMMRLAGNNDIEELKKVMFAPVCVRRTGRACQTESLTCGEPRPEKAAPT